VSELARYRSVALGVAGRSLRNLLTTPALLLPPVVFPIFFLTAFAGGLSRVEDLPGFDFPAGYTAFEFVFVLLQAAAFSGVFTGFGMAQDFETGIVRRMMLSAPWRSAVALGYVLVGVGRLLIVGSVVTVVALLAGMEVRGGAVDLFGLFALALLANVAATLWATGIAMRFRTFQAGPMMQIPIFLVILLAPVYVPIDLLSGWIKAVASVNPTTALLDAGRGFIAGEPTGVALAFAAGAGLVAVFSVWALRSLRRAEAAG
jgi:ABC-type multidrug transport system permease subunit